ncbi:MAG: DNA gyrase inhibitor YacG [Burkholderiales bacterium]
MAKALAVSCPRCGAQVKWSAENRYRPFCSERCKLIDLGDWAMERYRVPVDEDKSAPDDQERE